MDQLSDLAPTLGGGGMLALGLAALLRVLPGAIRRIAGALSTAWEKRSAAQLARAEAKRITAQTEQTEAQRSIADAETIAGALAEMRAMREEHAAEMREMRDAVAECEERHRSLQAAHAREMSALRRYIEALRREMTRRGWTPPEMPALAGEET